MSIPFPRVYEQMDIVVPVYGAIPLLLACLAPLERAHVFLIDDGSPDERPFATLRRKYPLLTYERQANAGFIAACHHGAALGQRPYILFLNSDVVPNETALWGMWDKLERTEGDIAGCRLLFPAPPDHLRLIQHAGVARNVLGVPYHPFMGQIELCPHARRDLQVNAVTGAAFLIRRTSWEALGGFDPAYAPGVYEDVALCWKARAAGYTVWYVGSAAMIHQQHGSQTPEHNWFGDNAERNLQRLLQQFGQQPSDEEIFYGPLAGRMP
jgi:GT2 family glycosyltransferase